MDNKNYDNRIEQIRLLAQVYGWQETKFDLYNCMLSYRRSGVLMNVYYTKMTVGTAMDHPKLGKTQLFRKYVSMELLEKLFGNPRQHTDKGYLKKTSGNFKRWY